MGLNIEQLKRWHWCLIGLVAGLALSYWHLPQVPGQIPTLSLKTFEGDLGRSLEQGHPPLVDLVVYPPAGGRQRVMGRELLASDVKIANQPPHYIAFWLDVPCPYHAPAKAPPGPSFSVRDRLDAAIAKQHAITYRYAWWAPPWVVFTLWTGGSVLVVGGIWPTLIFILTAAGLGRKPSKDDYDLERFGHEPEPSQRSAAEQAALDEAIAAALAEAKKGDHAKPSPLPQPVVTAPPPVLHNEPLEAAEPADEEDPKSFSGTYYPTAAHAPKQVGE